MIEEPQQQLIPDVSIYRTTADWHRAGVAVLAEHSVATVVEADEPTMISLDPELHQSYIEILDRQSEQRVVTVIEVLSPTNKHPGPGRDAYLAKTKEVRSSTTHLIEIDLLRRGDNTIGVFDWALSEQRAYDYLISVNRAVGLRCNFETYPRTLRERLPRIRVPLANGDADVVLDVQAVVAQAYGAGRYQVRLRYDRPCLPALSEDDQAWANDCIRKAMAQ